MWLFSFNVCSKRIASDGAHTMMRLLINVLVMMQWPDMRRCYFFLFSFSWGNWGLYSLRKIFNVIKWQRWNLDKGLTDFKPQGLSCCAVLSCSVTSDSLRPCINCGLEGSSVHGDSPGKNAIPFSRGSSWPRDQTQVSHIAYIDTNLFVQKKL